MMPSTDFSVLIPARFASIRLPGKVLLDIHGKPMIVRVVEQALQSHARSVVVVTDHHEIYRAVKDYGYAALMSCQVHQSGSDRLAEAVHLLKLPEQAMIVNVQGDEPGIAPQLINQVAQQLQQSQGMMSSACCPLENSAAMFDSNVVKVVLDQQQQALYFSRAPIPYARDAFAQGQDKLPEGLPVYQHIGIYAYRVKFLHHYSTLSCCALEQFEALEQLRVLWHGYRISLSIVPSPIFPSIDSAEDLVRFNQLWQNHQLA